MGRFVVEFMRIEEPSVHATTILFRLNGWRNKNDDGRVGGICFFLYVCMMMLFFFFLSKSSILEKKNTHTHDFQIV